MRPIILSALLFFNFTQVVDAQSNQLQVNGYDDLGKKHGLWVEYLDSNFNKTKKDDADFLYYKEYCHGKRFAWVSGTYKKCKLHVEAKEWDSQKPVLLNGRYVFTHPNKKGYTITYTFKDGRLIYYRAEWDESGYYYQEWDYTSKYENSEWSYYVTGQTHKNKIWRGFVYHDEKGKRKVIGKKYDVTE